jgi:hypothetical protein
MSRKHGSIHTLPHTSSWLSAQLVKHRDNFIPLPLLSDNIRITRACSKHGVEENSYIILVRNHDGKWTLGRLRSRWEDNNKLNLKEINCESVNRSCQRTVTGSYKHTVMKFCVLIHGKGLELFLEHTVGFQRFEYAASEDKRDKYVIRGRAK